MECHTENQRFVMNFLNAHILSCDISSMNGYVTEEKTNFLEVKFEKQAGERNSDPIIPLALVIFKIFF